ncbi:hypothetical protein B4U80_14281, partial [Leptotrombidium deliense]
MVAFIVDVIAQCAFRLDIGAYKDFSNVYVNRLTKAFQVNVWRIITSMIIPDKIQRMFDMQLQSNDTLTFLAKNFGKLKNERMKYEAEDEDMLDSMIRSISKHDVNNNKGLTDSEVVSQCAT